MLNIIHKKFKSSYNPNKIERKFYKVWCEMNRRCRQNTNDRNDKSYFKKGIKVCSRWQKFEYFFIDMWDKYLIHRNMNNGDTEIDRINVKKGYNPLNCKWSTRQENMNNTHNIIKIKGKTFTEWESILGISRETLRRRYNIGWSINRVLSGKLLKPGRKSLQVN